MTENNNSNPIRTSRDKFIIDGVDVSKCKHFKNRTCIADYLLTDTDFSEAKCELCKNCYFKQLARKTQECKNWKETANQYAKNEEYYKSQVDKYKAENEQAEQELERIREIIKQMNNECFYNDFECKDCDMKNGCTYFNKSIILQIIDEVG